MPPKENTTHPAQPEAPYGYTPTGRIRKKPTKQHLKVAVPSVSEPTPLAGTKKRLYKCPACAFDFRHRSDPHRAVWQHLLYFATQQLKKDQKHKDAYAALKAASKPEKTTVDDLKRERKRANSAKWRAKSMRKAKRSSAMGAAKLKFERNLRRAGEFSEEALKKLVDEKMAEWDSKN